MTVVNARLPWALFLPLAGVTELGGLILLLSGHGIGWAAVLAPILGLLAMRGPVRPRFEFMEEGVIWSRAVPRHSQSWRAGFGLSNSRRRVCR